MLEIFRPKEYLDSIYQIDFSKLKSKGIKGLILDLDETLLPREMLDITPVLFSFIEGLKDKGFSIFLLSNSIHEARVEYVGKTFNIPFSVFAMKPLPFAFENAKKKLGLNTNEVAVIGDQLFMDIWGGNLAKMYTIMVKPMTPEKIWIRQLMRETEKYVLDRLELN